MKIQCETCGKRYEYPQDEFCPYCGCYNDPPRAKTGLRTSSAFTAASAPRPQASYGRPASSAKTAKKQPAFSPSTQKKSAGKRTNLAGIIVVVVIVFCFALPTLLGLVLQMVLSDQPEPAYPEPEYSAAVYNEEEGLWDTGEAPAPDWFLETVPASVINFDGDEIGQAGGVALYLNSCGLLEGSGTEPILVEGEKLIFLDLTAELYDDETFQEYGFLLPYLLEGEDYGYWVEPSFLDGIQYDFVPFDPDTLLFQPTVTGKLLYAVPEDWEQFTLYYEDWEGNTFAKTIYL